jgi:tetratricopeptide (TPR) repeat protein
MQTKSSKFQTFILIAAFCALTLVGACSSKTGDATSVKAAENTPADAELNSVLKIIEKTPDSPAGYTQLAAFYIRKARESGDFSLNTKAETAINQALEIEPQNIPAKKLQASLNLTFHRFDEGRKLGLELQKELPNDAFVYGILTDAYVETGNYKEAVLAAQKMVDLKPNSSSYARVSHIRALHGDTRGAIEMMTLAARTADPQDKEAQSWCLVMLGKEYFKTGDFAAAEKIYDEALQILPNYHLAAAQKGIVRAAQGDFESAIKYLTDAQNRAPHTEAVIILGDIYTRQGDAEKAKQQYDLAEKIEREAGADSHRLSLLWADRDERFDEALQIAAKDYAANKDITAADIYAWCQYKKGNLQEAKSAIKVAMRLKTKDARIFYHAGMIEKGLGNKREAAKLLRLALETNPAFDFVQAEKAKTALRELS